MPEDAPGPRRTFGPVVALELVAAALAAYAASKPWVTGRGAESAPGGTSMSWDQVASSPLGTALALVVLACVGVVLVTRGRFRRVVAGLALVAALGYAATVVWAPSRLPDHLVEQVRRRTGTELDSTSLTGWFWLAVASALLVVVATGLALRLVRSWPEMGARYDAPTAPRADATTGEQPTGSSTGNHTENPTENPTENIDIWKALDEGRDPTA